MKAFGTMTAALAASMLALPALAAPWQVLELEQDGYQLRYAYQFDDTGQYRFAASCVIGSMGYNFLLVTPDAWEDTTSYAPEVPLTMTFDGTAHPNLKFAFTNGSGLVTVVYQSENFAGEAEGLIEGLKEAARIEMSYFDKQVVFSGQGSTAAIEAMQTACSFI